MLYPCTPQIDEIAYGPATLTGGCPYVGPYLSAA